MSDPNPYRSPEAVDREKVPTSERVANSLAVGCICLPVGLIAGFFLGPLLSAPIEPVMINGVPQPVCGMPVLAQIAFGAFCGAGIALASGSVLGWYVPLPKPARKRAPANPTSSASPDSD